MISETIKILNQLRDEYGIGNKELAKFGANVDEYGILIIDADDSKCLHTLFVAVSKCLIERLPRRASGENLINSRKRNKNTPKS